MEKPLLPNGATKEFLGDESVSLKSFQEQQTDDDLVGYRHEDDEAEDLTAEEEDDEFHAATCLASDELQLLVGARRMYSEVDDKKPYIVEIFQILLYLDGRRQKTKVHQRRHKRHARFLHSIRYSRQQNFKEVKAIIWCLRVTIHRWG